MPETQHNAPLAIVMISLNEAHNIDHVLDSIVSLGAEVYLLDSFSSDGTVEIAQHRGVYVSQRAFTNFGDQWNHALKNMPITAPWTMKLDPDERLTPELVQSINEALKPDAPEAGFSLNRRLWFMGKPMPVRQDVLRIWRTGECRFADVLVNEHPLVEGRIGQLSGTLEHHDSPNLHHWFEKQNRYTTSEARTFFEGRALAATPKFLGSTLERRMWLKRAYRFVPFRHHLMFLYCWLWLGAWRSGRPGLIWARLRATVFRMREDKLYEMRSLGFVYDGDTPSLQKSRD
ncbi:MAG: glycosyltransferase family 2 protein [Pseudomonadota bacterium]